ncbi:hypothetical protein, partial [Streptococcus danieliae]|uniref:hypothetical protein n=1 Tax=Streptococcus danieliae TaxID=747656 RepID=UPI001F42DF25
MWKVQIPYSFFCHSEHKKRVYNILCKRKKRINPVIVELDKKILLERFIPMTQFITDLTTFLANHS